MVLTQTT